MVPLARTVANRLLEADVLATAKQIERAEGGLRIRLVQDEGAGHSPRTGKIKRIGLRPARRRERALELMHRADQSEVDGIARQSIAGDRIAWHMALLKNPSSHSDGARQDYIGGDAIREGDGERHRKVLVGAHEYHEGDEPNDGGAERQDQETPQEKFEKPHRDPPGLANKA